MKTYKNKDVHSLYNFGVDFAEDTYIEKLPPEPIEVPRSNYLT